MPILQIIPLQRQSQFLRAELLIWVLVLTWVLVYGLNSLRVIQLQQSACESVACCTDARQCAAPPTEVGAPQVVVCNLAVAAAARYGPRISAGLSRLPIIRICSFFWSNTCCSSNLSLITAHVEPHVAVHTFSETLSSCEPVALDQAS